MMKPKLNIHTNLNNNIINTSNNNNNNNTSNSISFIYNIFNRQKYKLQNNSNNLYLNTLPPINLKIISLCLIWYFISSLTSQLTKKILTDFNFPIFIGECQFFISALLSISLIIILINYPILINYFPKNSVPIAFIQQTNLIINNKLYSSSSSSTSSNNSNLINSNFLFFLKNSIYNLPNLFDKNVFRSILPMGFFQFFGKLFSLAATAAVPIATVASIRSLSPLLIVAGYRIYYKVKFPLSTYMSLIPLVLGVVIIVISQAKDHSKSLSHSMTTSAVVGSLDNNDSTGTTTITDTEAAAAAKAAAADAAIAAANSAMTAVVEAGTAVVEAGTAVAIKILNKRDNLDQSMPLISSSSDPQVVNSAKLASVSDYPALYMNFSDYLKGLIYASSSALIFAIQSIYAKNIMSTSDLFVNKHNTNNNKHHNIPNDSFVTTNNSNIDPQQQHPVNKIKFRSNSISMPSPGSLSLPNTDDNSNRINIDSDIQLDEKSSSSSLSLDENQFPNILPLSENFKKPFPILKPINSSSNLSDYENKNELLLNDNKPDKVTVLLYCAIFGFSLSFPIFMIYELPSLLFGKKLIIDNELIDKTIFKIPWGLLILNGFSHFCQALLAFHILGSLPTVTYSIANLMKRIIIMTVSMIMTGKQLTFHEFLGLLHIAIGLYAYDKWGSHKR